jgi:hypothetical protein
MEIQVGRALADTALKSIRRPHVSPKLPGELLAAVVGPD